MKWKQASAKYRKDIARAMMAATPEMLTEGRDRPDELSIRRALTRWGFNTKQARLKPPTDVAEVLALVAPNSAPISALTDAAVARRLLEQATSRLDGKTAAASTARRHRTILANSMDYAVEPGLAGLQSDPGPEVGRASHVQGKWTGRCVVNPRQARALLAAVRAQQPSGPRLVAFFGLMYYAGLRPEEAVSLTRGLPDSSAPRRRPTTGANCIFATRHRTRAGDWTDDGSARERRQLKHRAEGDSRIVPVHPELAHLLRDHLAQFGAADDGRLFSGVRGGELATVTYRRAWIKARQDALTAAEQASPLARRPYDLRHACLSTWLNGGVYPTQVAEWAGHSVDVLLRIYAKCVVGQDEAGQAADRRSAPPGLTRHPPSPVQVPAPRRGLFSAPLDDPEFWHVFGTATRINRPTAAHNRTSARRPRSRR